MAEPCPFGSDTATPGLGQLRQGHRQKKHACLSESRAFIIMLRGWTLMTKVIAKQIADCADGVAP